jgi:hypothetical protein
MGRVINTNSPGKRRNYAMRTIAEMMRRLGQKQGEVDAEAKDMIATVYYCLKEIDEGVIESIEAWEKRGYWKKADKFQLEWMWSGDMAKRLHKLISEEDWDALPDVMMKLFPHFSNIEINKMMRNSSIWEGRYDQFVAETES